MRTGAYTRDMTYQEHKRVENIEEVFVPRETREAKMELNILLAYGY